MSNLHPELALQHDPQTGRYIIMFDASIYKESSCSRKLFYKLIRGLRSSTKEFKMEYGTAFHKSMVEFYTTGNLDNMIKLATDHYCSPEIFIPETDWRTPANLVTTVVKYWQQYGEGKERLVAVKDNEGKPILEKTFAIPYYQDDLFEVLLTGTIDMIALDNLTGYTLLVDHKTTSLTQVDNYLNSYYLSPQLMLYNYVYKLLFPENKSSVGCMINGIFINKTAKPIFKRSDVIVFSDEMIRRFEVHLDTTLMNLLNNLRLYLKGETFTSFPYNFTACDTKFGQCEFHRICSMDSKEDQESLLESEFKKVTYDPTKFHE